MSDYQAFLREKAPVAQSTGLAVVPTLSDALSGFQKHSVTWALKKGRAALFADTGLGKTRMQLEWARRILDYIRSLGGIGRVLILCPLAVAAQTVREGASIGIEVAHVREAADVVAGINIANYERLDRFDPALFDAVILDESGILKSYTGSTKEALVERFRDTRYKLACTATPAPNDHMELGNHSEFLSVLPSYEMLSRWFINDTSTFGTYKLKSHAVTAFWDWVTSWALCVGKPSDLGYSDEGYDLPPLNIVQHSLAVDVLQDRGDKLFRDPELSATRVHQEKRRTLAARAAKVGALVVAEPAEPWILWCDTNYEADALKAAVPDAIDVRGNMSDEKKEAALLGFSSGAILHIITKPKIAGFGLNWQHCRRMARIGPTFSYEQFYQEVRRAWRFGQLHPVDAHVVMGATEVDVWNIMMRKSADHEAMKVEMFAAMRRARSRESPTMQYNPTHVGRLPAWMENRA